MEVEGRGLEKRQGPACSWELPRAVPVRTAWEMGQKLPGESLGQKLFFLILCPLEVAGKVSDPCRRLGRAQRL